jgi:hypothetical protein
MLMAALILTFGALAIDMVLVVYESAKVWKLFSRALRRACGEENP